MYNHIIVSAEDFRFLREAGFRESHQSVCRAMQYYYTDFPTSAVKFRQALGSMLKDALELIGEDARAAGLCDCISILHGSLPEEHLGSDVLLSMNGLRMAGNAYVHMNYSGRDESQDRMDMYQWAMTVAAWLTDLKQHIEECMAKVEERRRQPEVRLVRVAPPQNHKVEHPQEDTGTDDVPPAAERKGGSGWKPYAAAGGAAAVAAAFLYLILRK